VPETSIFDQTSFEVIAPDSSRQIVRVTESPFVIGRGGGNHLQLSDRAISRQCGALVLEDDSYLLQDRGQRTGIFVNGEKIDHRILKNGDVVTFGEGSTYKLIFRSTKADTSIESLLTRIGSISTEKSSPSGLSKLNLLLEASMLLHSNLPLEAVLNTMLDHAVAITHADRGLLLEPNPDGSLHVRLARNRETKSLAPQSLSPSQTTLRLALQQQSGVITEDLAQADLELQAAQSIVAQRLRAIVAIPLYAMVRADSAESLLQPTRGNFLGLVYLDSQRPAAFSKIDRQILDVIAIEAASILDNARLVELERQRARLEQELSIARDIQQALLPHGFKDVPYLGVSGVNFPCLEVGGDYYDVFSMGEDRTAFLLADVSGKGLGAALLTTMLQGALSGLTNESNPGHVFNHLNRFLCEHEDVSRYATLFFGIIDRHGRIEYINAGHPSPLLLRRGEISEPFKEGTFPVGLIPGTEYTTARLELQPEDTLFLYSDGVTEAWNKDKKMFGVSRLCDVLAGHRDAPLASLQKRVIDEVKTFAGGVSQADDITVLLIRYLGEPKTAGEFDETYAINPES